MNEDMNDRLLRRRKRFRRFLKEDQYFEFYRYKSTGHLVSIDYDDYIKAGVSGFTVPCIVFATGVTFNVQFESLRGLTPLEVLAEAAA